MRKNPFMSLWLRTANRVAGSLRGHATAQVKRQLQAAAADAIAPAAPKAKRRGKR